MLPGSPSDWAILFAKPPLWINVALGRRVLADTERACQR